MSSNPNSTYDALLVVSFGGPEGMDDVIPFLENVVQGRNVPRERLLEVAHHYELFGGVSPINAQNRKLIACLEEDFETHGIKLPIYFGNRNWHPLLAETMSQMRDDGIRHALAFVTSAYSSYSSCRQYLENIESARSVVGAGAPQVDKIRAFFNHPEFIRANVEQINTAIADISAGQRGSIHIAFTAHSIPESMASNCDYEKQLNETSRLVAESLDIENWKMVFQSRSGSPLQPWLGPDITDHLRELKSKNVNDVVVAPIGFVSDHMEIVYDLDLEAGSLAEQLGLNMRRAETAGTHPAFVKMVRELVMERLDPTTERKSAGSYGARTDCFSATCCLAR